MKKFFSYYIVFCLNITAFLYPMDDQLSAPKSPITTLDTPPVSPNLTRLALDGQKTAPSLHSPIAAGPGRRRQVKIAPWLQARSSTPAKTDLSEEVSEILPQHSAAPSSFHSLLQALHEHNQSYDHPIRDLSSPGTPPAPPSSPAAPTVNESTIEESPIATQTTRSFHQTLTPQMQTPSHLLLMKKFLNMLHPPDISKINIFAGASSVAGFLLLSSQQNPTQITRGLPVASIADTGFNALTTVAGSGVSLAGTTAGIVTRVMSGGTLDSIMITTKIAATIALIVVVRQTASSFNGWVHEWLHAACKSEKELMEQKFNAKVDENQRITQQLFNDFDATTNEKIRIFTQQMTRALTQVRTEQHNGMTLVARTFAHIGDMLSQNTDNRLRPTQLQLEATARSRSPNTTAPTTHNVIESTEQPQQPSTLNSQTTTLTDAAQAFHQAAADLKDMTAKATREEQQIDIPTPILAPQLPPKKEKTKCDSCCTCC